MFDIPDERKIKREALRGKLKQLDFTMIQKSVWLHPFPCYDELEMLKEFFGFTNKNYLMIETKNIGHHATTLKHSYKLS